MKLSLLNLLKCPYCGAELQVKEIYKRHEDEIDIGELECKCCRYPILEGILDLRNGYAEEYALDLLDKRRAHSALAFLLTRYAEASCQVRAFLKPKSMYGPTLSRFLLAFTHIQAERVYKKYSNEKTSFIDLLGSNSWQTYLKHRFSSQSLWLLYPFLPLLKQNRGRVLDLCCGAGHSSFVIQHHVDPQELICADHTFGSLYLAKKYMVKQAQFICLDANNPLPFKPGSFDSVLVLDALHYIKNRSLVASEIERILLSQSCFLALHLHNSLQHNIAAGKAMPPMSWISLFERFAIKALPDRELVEEFISSDRLDLTKDYDEQELNSSADVSIVGVGDSSFFKVFEGVQSEFLQEKSNLIINPIYELSRRGDRILLKRRFPDENFGKESPLAEKYLPERYILPAAFLRSGTSRAVAKEISSEQAGAEIEELMREFVVINAPQGYG